MAKLAFDLSSEWIESDGLGGFAMGTIGGWRTRRYHALLAPALAPPTGRHVLVNGFDAFVETAAGTFPLSTQCYAPDHLAPLGWQSLTGFANEPWPTWHFELPDGTHVVQELFAVHEAPIVVVGWRLDDGARAKRRRAGRPAVRLRVRPFLSGRDHHALHHANDALRFESECAEARAGESRVAWRPYATLPAATSLANGAWRSDPHWYHSFRCLEETARGLDDLESLGSPGELEFDLARAPAWWIVGAERHVVRAKRGGRTEVSAVSPLSSKLPAARFAERLRAAEAKRRARFPSALARAADQFLVHRGAGKSVLAGFPWFTDWGRDTAIALRGLCLATGRLDDARRVLLEWSRALVDGVVPNRFRDHGAPPELGAADASLWFVVAVEELLAADARAPKRARVVDRAARAALLDACTSILAACEQGRPGLRVDGDGLLAVGDPADSAREGVAPTWMDARVDGIAITPRVGKPVEIEALWWNALQFAAEHLPGGARWRRLAAKARRSFLARFADAPRDGAPAAGLPDVVDVDHVAGALDWSFRPNQLFAIGGLPRALLRGPAARRLADAVAARLWTPRGVRSLAPEDPRYAPRYDGGPRARDAAYHQGTAWPWLLHALVDGFARSRGGSAAARRDAHDRFAGPLLAELGARLTPHVAEIADGDAPHRWRGCPMQAWSLGALLQCEALRDGTTRRRRS